MNLSRLDLNLLIAMDALFAVRSVSRAGERLHSSQSAAKIHQAREREERRVFRGGTIETRRTLVR
jgi:LysR family nod box-dependent transcriptional activator